MAAGDTFRAAASDQLEVWAERTGCEIVVAEGENVKAQSGMLAESCTNIALSFAFKSNSHFCLVLSQAVKRGKEEGYDVILCDTSGRMFCYICIFYRSLLYRMLYVLVSYSSICFVFMHSAESVELEIICNELFPCSNLFIYFAFMKGFIQTIS